MIEAVIIDDEPNSRELLGNMLRNYCENVTVIGEAHDVKSGIVLIKLKKPKLVFLDIEMPDGNGFDILDMTKEHSFSIVFITGYDHYAIKAIKYAALDYLLKPLELSELREAVQKVSQRGSTAGLQFHFFNQTLPKEAETIEQIVIPDRNQYEIVDLDSIIYLEAKGNYVLFTWKTRILD